MSDLPLVVHRHAVTAPPGLDFLDPGERRRLAALGSGVERDAFAARRWFVRQVVADVVGRQPGEIALRQRCPRCGGPHGHPTVTVPRGRAPFVSWSSSARHVVVAVDHHPVGVDVVDRADLVGWARTEAVLKATGHGLEVDPALLDVAGGRVRRWDGPGRRPRLRVTDVDLGDGLVGAVAHAPRRCVTVVPAAPAGRATG